MSRCISVPPNTLLRVQAVTNSAWVQRVTITPSNNPGRRICWQGKGEGNHLIGQDCFNIGPCDGYVTFTIEIEHTRDGCRWSRSNAIVQQYGCGSNRTVTVLSEDGADCDYNDTIVSFMWWQR